MEQHPIPQNVTGFEFKLVGDMTLKQFGYLATGCIIAYLLTKATLIPFIFRYPLAGFSALLGVALAFLPIEERPLDRWIIAFFSRVYEPTHYVWKKTTRPPEALMQLAHFSPSTPVLQKKAEPEKPVATNQPVASYLATLHPQVTPHNKTEEDISLQKITHFFTHETLPTPLVSTRPRVVMQTQQILSDAPATTSQPDPITSPDALLLQRNNELSSRIGLLQKELSSQSLSKERFLELQKELTHLLQEKEKFLNELVVLRKQLEEKLNDPAVRPTELAQALKPKTVKIISPQVAPQKGLAYLTTFPNIVTGIVKTGDGELLVNILVTVKDHEEMPVRALKTNKLGQFAASAQLPNGTYHIEVEDPQKRYQFDIVEVSLNGTVLPPLEIWAKSKRDLQRQILHEELFGRKDL